MGQPISELDPAGRWESAIAADLIQRPGARVVSIAEISGATDTEGPQAAAPADRDWCWKEIAVNGRVCSEFHQPFTAVVFSTTRNFGKSFSPSASLLLIGKNIF